MTSIYPDPGINPRGTCLTDLARRALPGVRVATDPHRLSSSRLAGRLSGFVWRERGKNPYTDGETLRWESGEPSHAWDIFNTPERRVGVQIHPVLYSTIRDTALFILFFSASHAVQNHGLPSGCGQLVSELGPPPAKRGMGQFSPAAEQPFRGRRHAGGAGSTALPSAIDGIGRDPGDAVTGRKRGKPWGLGEWGMGKERMDMD